MENDTPEDTSRVSVSVQIAQPTHTHTNTKVHPLTFHLPNRTEVLLKSVIKFGIGDGFKITRINSSSRCGKTTFTHTGVVSQPPFIKIRVS